MTTLYFEASDEDDLRKTGFSKDGINQCPQIYIGLLVGLGGYTIGYDIFEGDTYEGHTLIPFIEKICKKFNLNKPIIVADAGLLSNENIAALEAQNYQYILGARPKNEALTIKRMILDNQFSDGKTISLKKTENTRLIINYSQARAKKDAYNRKRGLNRLEKQVKSGKLTKSSINNKGYNKYLKLNGDVAIEVGYDKYNHDQAWDGLKGYVTNTKLSDIEVIDNYKNLWHIEKVFRMSKTDLRYALSTTGSEIALKPISVIIYSIYKELERVLYEEKSTLSLKKAAEITHNMYQITNTLPESKHTKS